MTEEVQPVAEEVQPAVAIKPRKQDRSTLALLLIAGLIAVGGIGFAVGRFTAPAAASSGSGDRNFGFEGGRALPSFAPGQSFNPGQFGGANGGLRNGGITGTVVSIDSNSITVRLADGSTVTVGLTGSTTFHSQTAASAGDVQAGTTVEVSVTVEPNASGQPAPSASGQSGGRNLTASDVLITTP